MGAIENEQITQSIGRFISERTIERIKEGSGTFAQAVVLAQLDALNVSLEAFAVFALATTDHGKESDESIALALTGEVIHVLRTVIRNPSSLRQRADVVRAAMIESMPKGSA